MASFMDNWLQKGKKPEAKLDAPTEATPAPAKPAAPVVPTKRIFAPGPAPIDTLSDELLLALFDHLPSPRDKLRLALVCARWRALAADRSLWRSGRALDLRMGVWLAHLLGEQHPLPTPEPVTFRLVGNEDGIDAVSTLARARRVFDVTQLGAHVHEVVMLFADDATAAAVLAACGGDAVTSVRLIMCQLRGKSIAAVVPGLRGLKELHFQPGQMPTADNIDDFFDVDACIVPRSQAHLPRKKKIAVGAPAGQDPYAALFAATAKLRGFEELELTLNVAPKDWFPPTGLTPRAHLNTPSNIKRLTLRGDMIFREGIFSHAWFPQLEELDLSGVAGTPSQEENIFGGEAPRGLRVLRCGEWLCEWNLVYPRLEELEFLGLMKDNRYPFPGNHFPRVRRFVTTASYAGIKPRWLTSQLLAGWPSLVTCLLRVTGGDVMCEVAEWHDDVVPAELRGLGFPDARDQPPQRHVLAGGVVVTATYKAPEARGEEECLEYCYEVRQA